MPIRFTLRDILTAYFRQSQKFWAVLWLAVAMGALYLLVTPSLYEADGSLLVKFGPDVTTDMTKSSINVQIAPNDRREIMQSNMEILQSHDVLEVVFSHIGIERIYPGLAGRVEGSDIPLEAAIRRLSEHDLTIRSSPQSNIIEVSALNRDPEVAAELVKELLSIFILRQSEVYNKPQTEYLHEQVTGAKAQLEDSQQKLRDFKIATGVSSPEDELAELLKQKSDAVSIATQSVDDAQVKLAELRDKEAETLSTYRPGSPAVALLRQSIREAERQVEERQENLKTTSKTSMLARQIAAIDQRIAGLEEQRNQYNDLKRKAQIDEDNYKNFLAHSEEARVNQTLTDKKITRISVVDNPVVPLKPARPRKMLTMAVSALAGLLLAAAVVAACELWDERFRTPEHVTRALHLPVCASAEPARLFAFMQPLLAQPPCIVHYASAYMGEGAHQAALDTAMCAANQSNKPVLFVETAPGKRPGLTSVANLQEAITTYEGSNLSYAVLDTSAKLPPLDELQALFSHLRQSFALTIIASSAVLHDTSGQSLSGLADATLLVIQAERTRAPVAQELKRLLTATGGNVRGAILVGRRFYIPRSVYRLFYQPHHVLSGWRMFFRLYFRWLRRVPKLLRGRAYAYTPRQ